MLGAYKRTFGNVFVDAEEGDTEVKEIKVELRNDKADALDQVAKLLGSGTDDWSEYGAIAEGEVYYKEGKKYGSGHFYLRITFSDLHQKERRISYAIYS